MVNPCKTSGLYVRWYHDIKTWSNIATNVLCVFLQHKYGKMMKTSENCCYQSSSTLLKIACDVINQQFLCWWEFSTIKLQHYITTVWECWPYYEGNGRCVINLQHNGQHKHWYCYVICLDMLPTILMVCHPYIFTSGWYRGHFSYQFWQVEQCQYWRQQHLSIMQLSIGSS